MNDSIPQQTDTTLSTLIERQVIDLTVKVATLGSELSTVAKDVAILSTSQANDRQRNEERYRDSKEALAGVSMQVSKLETLLKENTQATRESFEKAEESRSGAVRAFTAVIVAFALNAGWQLFLHFIH